MKKKRIFSVLLAAILLITLFSGCAAEAGNGNTGFAQSVQPTENVGPVRQQKEVSVQVYPVDLRFEECAQLTLPDDPYQPIEENPPQPGEGMQPSETETPPVTQPPDTTTTPVTGEGDDPQVEDKAAAGMEDLLGVQNSLNRADIMAFRYRQTDDSGNVYYCVQIQLQDDGDTKVYKGKLWPDINLVEWDRELLIYDADLAAGVSSAEDTDQDGQSEDSSASDSQGTPGTSGETEPPGEQEPSAAPEDDLKDKLKTALLKAERWHSCTEAGTYAHNQLLTRSATFGQTVLFTNEDCSAFQVQSYTAEGNFASIAVLSQYEAQILLEGTVRQISWNDDRNPVLRMTVQEAPEQPDDVIEDQINAYEGEIQKLKGAESRLRIAIVLLAVFNVLCLGLIFRRKIKQFRKRFRKETPQQASETAGKVRSIGTVHNIGSRSGQQDSFDVINCAAGTLAVVADGMGGLADGDKVSQKIVSTMRADSTRIRPGQKDNILCQMVAHANQEVNRMLGAARQYKCGSTLLAVLIENNMMHWATVGDSRIYLYRSGSLIQINREHIYCAELLEHAINGRIGFSEALRDAQADRLSSFVGMGELKHVDFSLNKLKLCTGDRVLLMSDGVFNTLNNREIARIIHSTADAADAAKCLEERILQKQAPNQDNFTCVILEV